MIFPMTDEVWRPLSVNDSESAAKYDALHEDVPKWMKKRFWDWVESSLYERVDNGEGELEEVRRSYCLDLELLDDLEMTLQIALPDVPAWDDDHDRISLMSCLQDSHKALDIADYLLSHGGNADPEVLNTLLEQGKSAWEVGERLGRPGLARRVAEGVQTSADHVMQASGSAGMKLARAWEALYGLHPDPSKAYSLAIKAVEDAAIPIVSPKNTRATLGRVIADMRAQKDWNLPMARKNEAAPSGEVLVGMMELLWGCQHDRHGGNDAFPPLTHEEAVVAVSLAVTLTHWFTTPDLVQRARNRLPQQ